LQVASEGSQIASEESLVAFGRLQGGFRVVTGHGHGVASVELQSGHRRFVGGLKKVKGGLSMVVGGLSGVTGGLSGVTGDLSGVIE
jgi:hypothetical protein